MTGNNFITNRTKLLIVIKNSLPTLALKLRQLGLVSNGLSSIWTQKFYALCVVKRT